MVARRVGLELVQEAERTSVTRAQDEACAEEVRLAQERSARNEAVIHCDNDGNVPRVSEFRIYCWLARQLFFLSISQMTMKMASFSLMTIDGVLTDGAEVELTYRIMPGQVGFVQGEHLRVLVAPTATAAPLAVSTSTATSTFYTKVYCLDPK